MGERTESAEMRGRVAPTARVGCCSHPRPTRRRGGMCVPSTVQHGAGLTRTARATADAFARPLPLPVASYECTGGLTQPRAADGSGRRGA